MLSKALTKLVMLAMIGVSFSLAAKAGGRIGGGGASRVCFDIPLSQAVDGQGLMTPEGRAHITSAEPLEYFIMMQISNGAKVIRYLESKHENFKDALEFLERPFALVSTNGNKSGSFAEALVRAQRRIGLITNAINMKDGIIRQKDADLIVGLGANCSLVYTVFRRGGIVYSDQGVLSHFDGTKMALMQLHEDISATFEKHLKDSVPVQNLIIKTWGYGEDKASQVIHNIQGQFGVKSSITAYLRPCPRCIVDWNSVQDLALFKSLGVRVDRFYRWKELGIDNYYILFLICREGSDGNLNPCLAINSSSQPATLNPNNHEISEKISVAKLLKTYGEFANANGGTRDEQLKLVMTVGTHAKPSLFAQIFGYKARYYLPLATFKIGLGTLVNERPYPALSEEPEISWQLTTSIYVPDKWGGWYDPAFLNLTIQ